MTNKPMLSVELRTLLERASNNLCSGEEAYAVQQELRAILDKQAECRCKRYGKDNPHWPCPVHAEPAAQHQGVPPLIATLHENGELIAAQSTIAQQAKLIELLKGKGQGQGEPVELDERVLYDAWRGSNLGYVRPFNKYEWSAWKARARIAEQHAPAAVVMPDFESACGHLVETAKDSNGDYINSYAILGAQIWEIARLNGVKP